MVIFGNFVVGAVFPVSFALTEGSVSCVNCSGIHFKVKHVNYVNGFFTFGMFFFSVALIRAAEYHHSLFRSVIFYPTGDMHVNLVF